MRGEQQQSGQNVRPIKGSPPLARGTGIGRAAGGRHLGITPACAGNSRVPQILHRYWRDHPRLRGEQRYKFMPSFPPSGSPPLARGTARPPSIRITCCRITPACAGNSKTGSILCGGRGDHPRLRGEQKYPHKVDIITLGSPPLARGTEHKYNVAADSQGITPACAGNSDQLCNRACGA